MSGDSRQSITPVLRRWRLAPDAWRLSGRVTPGRLDRYLKYRSARGLPESMKARFRAMRIPEQTISEVLGDIRGLEHWMDNWNLAAQRFLTEARGEERAGRWQEAAVARINAAMCFHVAHLVTDTDPRTLRTLRASCVTTFAQAVPRIMPQVKRFSLPWRTRSLPAYLLVPSPISEPAPLFVFLNGATTCKEELLLWSEPLTEAGVAVMTVDWPGTGESASFTSPMADCDDLTDAVFDIAEDHPDLDPDTVTIGGISLGGAVAIRCAAYDRRLLGAMAVTPPYDPMSWWGYVNPLVHLQLMTLASSDDDPEQVISEFELIDLIPRLRSPILVFGAGRDMVVPPEESVALAAAGGDLATLVWYPAGGHGLYGDLNDWMSLTATWVNSLAGRVQDESDEVGPKPPAVESRPQPAAAAPSAPPSTRVDHPARPVREPAPTLSKPDPGPDNQDDTHDEPDIWDE